MENLLIDQYFPKIIGNTLFNATYAEYIFKFDSNSGGKTLFSFLIPTCENYCDIGYAYAQRGQFEMAKFYYKKAHFMIPSKLKPKYLLWKLFIDNGMLHQAKYTAQEILSNTLKVENTLTIRAKAELQEWLTSIQN